MRGEAVKGVSFENCQLHFGRYVKVWNEWGSLRARAEASARRLAGSMAKLVAVGMLLWAAAVPARQGLTWLKTGVWQPVPAFAVFLSPEAKTYSLKLTSDKDTPLDLIPSLADFQSLDAVADSVSGRMVGLAIVVRWLLDSALALWLAAGAFACYVLSLNIRYGSTTSGQAN